MEATVHSGQSRVAKLHCIPTPSPTFKKDLWVHNTDKAGVDLPEGSPEKTYLLPGRYPRYRQLGKYFENAMTFYSF